MNNFVTALRAAGETTRLRLLLLCAKGELSVTELTQILGQSQPRISRHLKLMVEAGLLTRSPEGSQVFYRIAETTESAGLGLALVKLAPEGDAVIQRDQDRLQRIREQRSNRAASYFNAVAQDWETIRSNYIAEAAVEQVILNMLGDSPINKLIDIGTGNGRMLGLLASRVKKALGVDNSSEMLAVSRAKLTRFENIHLRKGDMYNLPVADSSFDLAIISLVLHYSDKPQSVINEAARVLESGGRLFLIDFAPHSEEKLRTEQQHHRLGFSDSEIERIIPIAGLSLLDTQRLEGESLTVVIWLAQKN